MSVVRKLGRLLLDSESRRGTFANLGDLPICVDVSPQQERDVWLAAGLGFSESRECRESTHCILRRMMFLELESSSNMEYFLL